MGVVHGINTGEAVMQVGVDYAEVDRIVRENATLRAENERLRAALERVVDADKAQDCYEIARAALEVP
jgi:regulator of replication initiation timing